ncbi:MAG: hypothetical protein A3I61_01445 [Acidobacteria bacterium RIFCSPLOWO2_02_FULL_68_18]|nr:MAG: hypothetical protein A3I61_01445 [Acidobacteria bacterium RIFCSPLOWO2_02_FULL_68_18]OFW51578.1 MAG: hypothetical protein A3G77_18840 [Acidobacteria bacterium RIFCSPLOWO2_12_FULL_68_19]
MEERPLTAGRTAMGVLRRIREKGVAGVSRAVWDRLEERLLEGYYERSLGIATAGRISRQALGYESAEWSEYGASTYGNIRRIMRAMEVDPDRDVFVDFGCGKGRVVIAAAFYPFARVIGVERSPALGDAARRNVERARSRLACPRIDIVTADASAYDVPDEATIIYFASPFSGATLDTVLDNVKASLVRSPRRLRVVSHGYDAANPFEQQIRRHEWLALSAEIPLQRSNSAWVYVNSRWTCGPVQPAA